MQSKPVIVLIILIGLVVGQGSMTLFQLDQDWKSFTQSQKSELISLSNYLYDNQMYERAVLAFFQFVYRYPGDSLEPYAYYYIGRCYEESGELKLAIDYYEKIQSRAISDTTLQQLATYRLGVSNLLAGENNAVLETVAKSNDPYLITLRGLAEFRKMQWMDSRQTLLAAEAGFNDTYYSVLLRDMYDYIDHDSNAVW